MRRVDGMSTVGTLFVVSLGMSLKEEQTLQRPFKPPRPQIVHVPLAPRWRHRGQTWENVVRQAAVQRVRTLLFMGRQQNLTRKSVEQGLESKWIIILRVTSVCNSTNADEMCQGNRAPVVREVDLAHRWNSKMLRLRWKHLASPRL